MKIKYDELFKRLSEDNEFSLRIAKIFFDVKHCDVIEDTDFILIDVYTDGGCASVTFYAEGADEISGIVDAGYDTCDISINEENYTDVENLIKEYIEY